MNQAAQPPMTVGVQHFDRMTALLDNRVTVPNVRILGSPNRTNWEALFSGAYDAAELPLARFVFNRDQGDPLVGLPIFPDRLFLQQYIYTRTEAAFGSLSDLRHRRIIVPGYYYTASFWHRHFLREAGVESNEVEWISTAPELDERMRIADDIKIKVMPSLHRGADLLLDGHGDCLMHEFTIPPPAGSEGRMRRLLSDVFNVQAEWYRRTNVFPAVHVIAVRAESLERRPDLGVELCRAFDEAKQHMYDWLQSERTIGLPFAREAIDHSLEVFGDDPWSYGLEKNESELNRFLDLAQLDGFTNRRAKIEEIFDRRSLEYQFKSRMTVKPGIVDRS